MKWIVISSALKLRSPDSKSFLWREKLPFKTLFSPFHPVTICQCRPRGRKSWLKHHAGRLGWGGAGGQGDRGIVGSSLIREKAEILPNWGFNYYEQCSAATLGRASLASGPPLVQEWPSKSRLGTEKGADPVRSRKFSTHDPGAGMF